MSTSACPTSLAPLHKGRACTNCRRRKIKCDAQRPRCGQCVKFEDAFGDCEYTDDGIPQSELLETQISILEARVRELEASQGLGQAPSAGGRATGSGLGLSEPCPGRIQQVRTSGILSGTKDAPISTEPVSTWAFEDLPLVLRDLALHNFFHRSYESGFFLNKKRFIETLKGNGTEKPTFALLNAVYLWGMILSSSDDLLDLESIFVSRALQSAAHALAEDHPQKVLQCIQAEVLLAMYFFSRAKPLEGKYHINAAVSLVLSSGLHKLRSSAVDTLGYLAGSLAGSHGVFLPPPRDSIEEGERIDAFWTVFLLNNSWTAVDGSPSNIPYTSPNSRIDTPWPLDEQGYRENRLKDVPFGSNTVLNFLAGVPDDATSEKAMHAKASILFEQGAHIGMQYRNYPESQHFATSFSRIDNLITNFIQGLASPDPSNPGIPMKTQICIHTMARSAQLSLHLPFVSDDPVSRVRVIEIARSIVKLMEDTKVATFHYIDYILAALWTATIQAVMEELKRTRSGDALFTEAELRVLCDSILTTMRAFAVRCPLMTAQLAQVQVKYTSLSST